MDTIPDTQTMAFECQSCGHLILGHPPGDCEKCGGGHWTSPPKLIVLQDEAGDVRV